MHCWKKLPDLANDIAVDAAGVAWVVGTTSRPGGYAVRRWDQGNSRSEDRGIGAERSEHDLSGVLSPLGKSLSRPKVGGQLIADAEEEYAVRI
jgi:hypothetical protein